MTIIYNSTTVKRIIRDVVKAQGGYRERAIMDAPHIVERAETWNAEHKVVNVTEVAADIDGYRAGFAVDLVTRSIVG